MKRSSCLRLPRKLDRDGASGQPDGSERRHPSRASIPRPRGQNANCETRFVFRFTNARWIEHMAASGDGFDQLGLDPLLIALLKKIPAPDKGWPAAQRIRWFRTFAMNVSQIYDEDAEPVEMTVDIVKEAAN